MKRPKPPLGWPPKYIRDEYGFPEPTMKYRILYYLDYARYRVLLLIWRLRGRE
jgi:hypothetical protein